MDRRIRRKLPPLNAIRTFEAVARNLSFRKAAEELFVTEPAVSRAIKILEEHFQARLFERLPKGLELTLEGKVLLGPVGDALDKIDVASGELYRSRLRKQLTLLITPYISTHWLVPKLSGFLDGHRDLDIEIINGVDSDFFAGTDFDVAIWWGDATLDGYELTPVFKRNLVPVCAPALLGRESPKDPAAFVDRSTLLHEFDYQYWQQWLEKSGAANVSAARGIIFSNYNSMVQATMHGLGVALLLQPFFSKSEGSTRLIAPFGTDCGLEIPYYLAYRSGTALSQEAADFVNFVLV